MRRFAGRFAGQTVGSRGDGSLGIGGCYVRMWVSGILATFGSLEGNLRNNDGAVNTTNDLKEQHMIWTSIVEEQAMSFNRCFNLLEFHWFW